VTANCCLSPIMLIIGISQFNCIEEDIRENEGDAIFFGYVAVCTRNAKLTKLVQIPLELQAHWLLRLSIVKLAAGVVWHVPWRFGVSVRQLREFCSEKLFSFV